MGGRGWSPAWGWVPGCGLSVCVCVATFRFWCGPFMLDCDVSAHVHVCVRMCLRMCMCVYVCVCVLLQAGEAQMMCRWVLHLLQTYSGTNKGRVSIQPAASLQQEAVGEAYRWNCLMNLEHCD